MIKFINLHKYFNNMRIRHERIKTLSVRRRHPYGASADNLRSERIMKRRIIKLIEYYELNKNILSEWQLNKLRLSSTFI